MYIETPDKSQIGKNRRHNIPGPEWCLNTSWYIIAKTPHIWIILGVYDGNTSVR